jgi:hypothetical protein
MWSRRAAAALVVALLVSGCSAEVVGTSAINPAEVDPAATATAAIGPTVVTRTVTTVSTVASTAPTTPATDLSGEVYGFVTAVDAARSELTLDKIDWFTGDAARQACAEDGVTGTDNNRCTGWYYRNNNPALRVVAVAPGAAISTLNGGVGSTPGDLSAVAAEVARNQHSPWRLTVTDGRVTELQEVYLP